MNFEMQMSGFMKTVLTKAFQGFFSSTKWKKKINKTNVFFLYVFFFAIARSDLRPSGVVNLSAYG